MAVLGFLILKGTAADKAESTGGRSEPVVASGQCTLVIDDRIAAQGSGEQPRSRDMPNRERDVTFAG